MTIIKNILLSLFILPIMPAAGQTWMYHAFPDSSAIWNFEMQADCAPIFAFSEYYSITIAGDTTINNQVYHKLNIPAVIRSYDTAICNIMSPGYIGAYRQEVLNKKVFFITPSSSTELLLYDFNMQVGDTVKGITASYTDTVESIDSVLVENTYRKRWNINTEYNISLIEGIGSNYGLIKQSPGNAIGTFPSFYITCFSRNAQTLYPDTSTNCALLTSLNSLNNILSPVEIFPNPSDRAFTISFSKTNMKEIQITDLFGNIVIKQALYLQSGFEIKELKSGTYILTLIDTNNKRINRKIVSCQR